MFAELKPDAYDYRMRSIRLEVSFWTVIDEIKAARQLSQ
jgi:predicted DNA-binding ribbon-helix-helix protein